MSVLHPYTGKFFGLILFVILCGAALLSDELPRAGVVLGVVAGISAIIVDKVSKHRWPQVGGRLISYLATGILVYSLTLSTRTSTWDFVLDAGFVALALLLAVAIRITRRSYFWLTTQDLLVLLFIVMLAPQLPIDLGQGVDISELILRTTVLLYACEYVLARGEQARARLLYTSAFALLLLSFQLF